MTKTLRPCRIVDLITTATDKRFELVARMADEIAEMMLADGSCTQPNLNDRGFTYQDIDAFWHFANALAAVEIKFRKNGSAASFGMEVRYA